MPTLTIRNVDSEVRDQIRIIAAKRGRSMEAEVRDILISFVRQQQGRPIEIATQIHQRFSKLGGAEDIKMPERGEMPAPIDFND